MCSFHTGPFILPKFNTVRLLPTSRSFGRFIHHNSESCIWSYYVYSTITKWQHYCTPGVTWQVAILRDWRIHRLSSLKLQKPQHLSVLMSRRINPSASEITAAAKIVYRILNANNIHACAIGSTAIACNTDIWFGRNPNVSLESSVVNFPSQAE